MIKEYLKIKYHRSLSNAVQQAYFDTANEMTSENTPAKQILATKIINESRMFVKVNGIDPEFLPLIRQIFVERECPPEHSESIGNITVENLENDFKHLKELTILDKSRIYGMCLCSDNISETQDNVTVKRKSPRSRLKSSASSVKRRK